MPVPKCRECNDFKIDKERAIKEHPSMYCLGYYCTHPNFKYPGRSVKASEAKTSPKWCPLRKGE